MPLQVLAFAAERESFTAGQILIKQGQAATSAYFLLNGTADLKSRTNRTWVMRSPVRCWVKLAMLGGISYSITATASEPVSAVRIDNALFKRVAAEYPEFGHAVLEALSEKLGHRCGNLMAFAACLTKARSFSNSVSSNLEGRQSPARGLMAAPSHVFP